MSELQDEVVTRFAPSPTGRLHLGHAYAALFAWERAKEAGGRFLLRMEDIDEGRSREEFVGGIYEDLRWLGIGWEEPVMFQSGRGDAYRAALDELRELGLTYPCFCTRREIEEEIANSGSAPHGPEGAHYPGICRGMEREEVEAKVRGGEKFALRIDGGKAFALAKKMAGGPLLIEERSTGEVREADPLALGDVVLARKDLGTSYHLAVTVDDAEQGVNLVTRGKDLIHATDLHRTLQALLGLPVPVWHHHGLVRDAAGRRLATRDAGRTIQNLRESGTTVESVRERCRLAS